VTTSRRHQRSGASSSSFLLAIRWEGGDQSIYLDSFVTEEAPAPENEKKTTANASGNVISHFRYWYHYWKWAAYFQHW
jgi:hypothetical protein